MSGSYRRKITLALLVAVLSAILIACSATPKPPPAAAHPATAEVSATASAAAATPTPLPSETAEASPTSAPVAEVPTPAPPPPNPAPTPTPVPVPLIPATARPNPILTPGDVFAGVGAAQICVKGYSTNVRDVSTEEKDRVYAEYGIAHHTTGQYEVDHLVPLELGGSNDIKNLWPEPALPTPGFHQKDLLENKLHDLVCAGAMPLAVAQHAIASDWYGAYLQYVIR